MGNLDTVVEKIYLPRRISIAIFIVLNGLMDLNKKVDQWCHTTILVAWQILKEKMKRGIHRTEEDILLSQKTTSSLWIMVSNIQSISL